jgi:hypothetical protein
MLAWAEDRETVLLQPCVCALVFVLLHPKWQQSTQANLLWGLPLRMYNMGLVRAGCV